MDPLPRASLPSSVLKQASLPNKANAKGITDKDVPKGAIDQISGKKVEEKKDSRSGKIAGHKVTHQSPAKAKQKLKLNKADDFLGLLLDKGSDRGSTAKAPNRELRGHVSGGTSKPPQLQRQDTRTSTLFSNVNVGPPPPQTPPPPLPAGIQQKAGAPPPPSGPPPALPPGIPQKAGAPPPPSGPPPALPPGIPQKGGAAPPPPSGPPPALPPGIPQKAGAAPPPPSGPPPALPPGIPQKAGAPPPPSGPPPALPPGIPQKAGAPPPPSGPPPALPPGIQQKAGAAPPPPSGPPPSPPTGSTRPTPSTLSPTSTPPPSRPTSARPTSAPPSSPTTAPPLPPKTGLQLPSRPPPPPISKIPTGTSKNPLPQGLPPSGAAVPNGGLMPSNRLSQGVGSDMNHEPTAKTASAAKTGDVQAIKSPEAKAEEKAGLLCAELKQTEATFVSGLEDLNKWATKMQNSPNAQVQKLGKDIGEKLKPLLGSARTLLKSLDEAMKKPDFNERNSALKEAYKSASENGYFVGIKGFVMDYETIHSDFTKLSSKQKSSFLTSEEEVKNNIESLLIQPIQRGPRHEMLLNELSKALNSFSDQMGKPIQELSETVKKTVDSINSEKKEKDISILKSKIYSSLIDGKESKELMNGIQKSLSKNIVEDFEYALKGDEEQAKKLREEITGTKEIPGGLEGKIKATEIAYLQANPKLVQLKKEDKALIEQRTELETQKAKLKKEIENLKTNKEIPTEKQEEGIKAKNLAIENIEIQINGDIKELKIQEQNLIKEWQQIQKQGTKEQADTKYKELLAKREEIAKKASTSLVAKQREVLAKVSELTPKLLDDLKPMEKQLEDKQTELLSAEKLDLEDIGKSLKKFNVIFSKTQEADKKIQDEVTHMIMSEHNSSKRAKMISGLVKTTISLINQGDFAAANTIQCVLVNLSINATSQKDEKFRKSLKVADLSNEGVNPEIKTLSKLDTVQRIKNYTTEKKIPNFAYPPSSLKRLASTYEEADPGEGSLDVNDLKTGFELSQKFYTNQSRKLNAIVDIF